MLLFLSVDFIIFTSYFAFLLCSPTFSCFIFCYSSIYSSINYSFSFSLFTRFVFKFFFSSTLFLPLINGRLGCFFVEFDLLSVFFYYFLVSYFLISSFLPLLFTTELFGRGGAFLSGTILLF